MNHQREHCFDDTCSIRHSLSEGDSEEYFCSLSIVEDCRVPREPLIRQDTWSCDCVDPDLRVTELAREERRSLRSVLNDVSCSIGLEWCLVEVEVTRRICH
jgi:hypothetical protein